jgi:hypothetical protein
MEVHQMSKSSPKHEHGHEQTQAHEHDHEHAAEIRVARFGALPGRVDLATTVAEQPALTANQAVDKYDSDSLGVRFSCLAADWGL